MTEFPEPEFIESNGVRLAVHRGGPPVEEARAPVVFLHGWPELAFSWRYQFPAFAEAGYAVFAPDQRGYGASEKPAGRDEYTMAKLTGDVAGLLDHYGLNEAVFVGHDWGALVMWALPFYQPDRVRALAGLNVPFIPRGRGKPIDRMRAAFGDKMYIVRFQEEGACEPALEKDMDRTMRFFLRRPRQKERGQGGGAFSTPDLDLISWLEADESTWPGETWLSDEDTAVYAKAFAAGGMTAPLHWYRNFDVNHEDMARFQPDGVPKGKIDIPSLMITAELDVACPPHLSDAMEAFFTDYERHDLKACGHWTQQEKPEEVNRIILDWLDRTL